MTTNWTEIAAAAPEFAARVFRVFGSGTNKTLATLRRDGAPRISATELTFGDGRVTLGMMAGSRKLHDVRRDPRVAIHSPTIEPPEPSRWLGDAKMSGRLVSVPPPEGEDYAAFAVDIAEIALTYVGDPADHLVIESWCEGAGWRTRTRT